MYRNTEVQKCSFPQVRFNLILTQVSSRSSAQHIQLLAIFFFCTSSTSNLYLAMHSSWKEKQKDSFRVGISVLLELHKCHLAPELELGARGGGWGGKLECLLYLVGVFCCCLDGFSVALFWWFCYFGWLVWGFIY